METILKTLKNKISWAQAQFQAALERLSVEWLPECGEPAQDLTVKRALMQIVIAWACALPLIALFLLLPIMPAIFVLIIALISCALCFLVAGILAQTRAIKFAAISLLMTLGGVMITIALAAGGIKSAVSFLLVVLFIETIKLSRGYLSQQKNYLPLLSMIALSSFAMIGSVASNNLLLDGNFVPSSVFWFQCLAISCVCSAYGMIRFVNIFGGGDEMSETAAQSPGQLSQPAQTMDLVPQFLDAMPGLITRHDKEGNVISTHGTNKDILGQNLINSRSLGLLKFIHVSDRIAYLAAIDDLRQKKPVEPIDLRFEINEGFQPIAQFIHMKAHFIPQYNANDRLLGFCIQFQASNEHQNNHSAHAQKEDELALAKTQLLAVVSHELKTPLNSIMGFSDILLQEIAGPLPNARTRAYVANIRQSGEHLLNVVNTMLDMSKIQNGHYLLHKDSFGIEMLLTRIEDMLKIQAERKDIELILNNDHNLPEIYADMHALMQILINLIGNAIKFTNQGGRVTLDVRVQDSQLELTIADTGIGIAQDKLAEIGHPFMQVSSDLSRQYEGTGLGLSLVKGLVRLHEGTMKITSELGLGTQVTITIPQTSDLKDNQLVEFSNSPNISDAQNAATKQQGHKGGNTHVA